MRANPEAAHLEKGQLVVRRTAEVGCAMLLAVGCTLQEGEPDSRYELPLAATVKPSEDSSLSRIDEILEDHPTGLEGWANEVLEAADCKDDADVSEYWEGMPRAIAIVSGCEGDTWLYDSVAEAEIGGDGRMPAMEGQQLWITDIPHDEYVTVEHFTFNRLGAEERSGTPLIVRQDALVHNWPL